MQSKDAPIIAVARNRLLLFFPPQLEWWCHSQSSASWQLRHLLSSAVTKPCEWMSPLCASLPLYASCYSICFYLRWNVVNPNEIIFFLDFVSLLECPAASPLLLLLLFLSFAKKLHICCVRAYTCWSSINYATFGRMCCGCVYARPSLGHATMPNRIRAYNHLCRRLCDPLQISKRWIPNKIYIACVRRHLADVAQRS